MPDISITIIDQTHLDDAQRAVEPATAEGVRAALGVLGPAIAGQTPVQTGFLRDSEHTFLADSTTGMFRTDAFYASFVRRRNPFVERGVDQAESAAVAAFEGAFQREMAVFTRG
jgi:hypothetical protein